MRGTAKLTLVFLVVALTSGAMTATLLAATAGNDPNVVTPDAASAPMRAVPPELAGLMHVFDRNQVSSDVIPGDPVVTLDRLGDRQPGENPLLARRVRLPTDLHGFVWPMSNGVCYSSPGPSGCYPIDLLRKSGVLVGIEFSGDSRIVRVFGIAIDGVETVTLALADRTQLTATVTDGAFYVDATDDPIQARWTMPDGTRAEATLPRPAP
jgi:hypothetical protein